MLRLGFRFLGLLLLAAAFASIVIDGTRSIAGNTLALTPLSQTIALAFPDKFQSLQTTVEKHVASFLWDPVLVSLLLLPAWLVFAGLGLLLLVLTQRRAPKIGYASRGA